MFGRFRDAFKLFYASDIHGSERCFLKFLNAAKFYRVHALVLGGDLTGKAVVPIVASNGLWRATFLQQDYVVQDEAQLAELEKSIRFNGFYPYRTTAGEVERLQQDPALQAAVFEQVMRESVERWVRLAEERLAGTGVVVYAIGGNDDEWFVDDILRSSDVIRYNEGTVLEIGPCQMVGTSYANPTPWHSPRECSEDELYRRLKAITDQLEPGRPAIYNFHVPPYDSGLDLAPMLRDDLTVVKVAGQPQMVPVGSRAVRHIIEERRPLLGLHGHIHESRGAARVGGALCLNPGSRYGEGVLDGAIVTIADGAIQAHQFVAG